MVLLTWLGCVKWDLERIDFADVAVMTQNVELAVVSASVTVGGRYEFENLDKDNQFNFEFGHQLALDAVKKSQHRQKKLYDLKSRGAVLEVGDSVLVKVVAFDGRHKLADKWEEEPYVIISQPNDGVPVYELKREDGQGRKRVLHRNLLLPIGHLSGFKKSDQQPPIPAPKMTKPIPKPRTR